MEPLTSNGMTAAEEKMLGGAIIGFEIINAFFSLDSDEPGKRLITFQIRPADAGRVVLSSGDQLENLRGGLDLYSDFGDSPEKKKSRKEVETLGFLYFTEGIDHWPARYALQITLPEALFDSLYEAAKVGCAPSHFSVTLKRWGDLKLDWNETYTWDNKASPALVLKSASFTLPLAAPADAEGTERNPLANALPATRLQIDQLTQRLDSNKSDIVKAMTRIFWALVILIVLGVGIVLQSGKG